MELFTFFKDGIHPVYSKDLKEDVFVDTYEFSLKEIFDNGFATIYHDYFGNELIFLSGELETIVLRIGGDYVMKIGGEDIPIFSSFISILGLLDKNGIKWDFYQKYCFSKQLCIESEGGAQFMFSFSCNKEEWLDRIYFSQNDGAPYGARL